VEEGVASLQRSPIYSAMADPNAAEMNALAGERSGDGECYHRHVYEGVVLVSSLLILHIFYFACIECNAMPVGRCARCSVTFELR